MDPEIRHPSLPLAFFLILAGFFLGGLSVVFTIGAPPALQLLVGEVAIILPALLFLRRKRYPLRETFRLRPASPGLLAVSAAIGVSITVLMDEVDRLVSRFISIPPQLEELLSQMLKAGSLAEVVGVALAAVVMAGVVEEMLFRGLLLQALEQRMDVTQAIFVSAVAFAFLHFMPWWIQIFLIGIVLGLLAWRCDSIWPSIVVHAINNGFALVQLNLADDALRWYEWHGHVYPPLVVAAAGVAVYAFKWVLRQTPPHTNP